MRTAYREVVVACSASMVERAPQWLIREGVDLEPGDPVSFYLRTDPRIAEGERYERIGTCRAIAIRRERAGDRMSVVSSGQTHREMDLMTKVLRPLSLVDRLPWDPVKDEPLSSLDLIGAYVNVPIGIARRLFNRESSFCVAGTKDSTPHVIMYAERMSDWMNGPSRLHPHGWRVITRTARDAPRIRPVARCIEVTATAYTTGHTIESIYRWDFMQRPLCTIFLMNDPKHGSLLGPHGFGDLLPLPPGSDILESVALALRMPYTSEDEDFLVTLGVLVYAGGLADRYSDFCVNSSRFLYNELLGKRDQRVRARLYNMEAMRQFLQGRLDCPVLQGVQFRVLPHAGASRDEAVTVGFPLALLMASSEVWMMFGRRHCLRCAETGQHEQMSVDLVDHSITRTVLQGALELVTLGCFDDATMDRWRALGVSDEDGMFVAGMAYLCGLWNVERLDDLVSCYVMQNAKHAILGRLVGLLVSVDILRTSETGPLIAEPFPRVVDAIVPYLVHDLDHGLISRETSPPTKRPRIEAIMRMDARAQPPRADSW